MDRLLVATPIILVTALIFVGLWLGWRSRARRQASAAHTGQAVVLGAEVHRERLLYVVTSDAADPLQRVTSRPLAFRARAELVVADNGVELRIPGSVPVTIPAAEIVGAGLATWTLDRVVGRDGLVFVRWALEGREVDSNFRSEDPERLLAALHRITPSAADDSAAPTTEVA